MGKHPMPVPGALICRSLISQLSRRREIRIWCLSARGLCVCVRPVFLCLWLSGEPRGGLRRESLAFSCCHFSVSPFALCPFIRGLGTGLSVSVCLSVRPFSRWRLRTDPARPGTGVSPARCWGSGQAPSQGCPRDPGPAGASHPASVPSRRRRRAQFGPGPCASPVSRVPFPPPPPFRDLGLEIGKQVRRCAEELTSLSGEVTLKGSPY